VLACSSQRSPQRFLPRILHGDQDAIGISGRLANNPSGNAVLVCKLRRRLYSSQACTIVCSTISPSFNSSKAMQKTLAPSGYRHA